MKLVRFGEPGNERPGLIDANGRIRDLSGHVHDIGGKALLPEYLRAIAQASLSTLPVVDPDVRIGPCVGGVGKIIGVGLNYADLLAESGIEPPDEPFVFLKATSAICGARDDLVLPAGSASTDWEVELGVVIGKPAHNIDESDAVDHIAGYCIVNDYSERDYALGPSSDPLWLSAQWARGKSSDTFAPLGPWLVTGDEIDNPEALDLWLEVDGHRYQDSNTAQMIFGVADLVTFASHYMSLQSGDVIMTGTPAGIGKAQTPEVHLKAGQVVRAGISGLGKQHQRVSEHCPPEIEAPQEPRRERYDWQAIYSPSP
jgi:2,4-diketo-3-deoxy-L-fuconate hydrolase